MEVTLNLKVIDDYLAAVPVAKHRDAFRETVSQLSNLPHHHDELSEFLSTFASHVADLFAANSVAIWFQSAKDMNVARKVDVGWSNLALDDVTVAAHDQLIQYAIQSTKSQVAKPFSPPVAGAGVCNPTDSYLLLAPAKFDSTNAAVIEIVLGPKPLRSPHEALMTSYLQWMDWLRQILQAGMQRCFQKQGVAHQVTDHVHALSALAETAELVEEIQNRIRDQIEQTINLFAGQNFGSLAANQAVAKQVHSLLESKGLRVKCPECGAAAILRCQKAGNAKHGAFMFDHYLDSGRTFHGGQTVFPSVELVSKPPRRKTAAKQ